MFIDFDQVFSFLYFKLKEFFSQGFHLSENLIIYSAAIWSGITLLLAGFIFLVLYKINKLKAEDLAEKKRALEALAEKDPMKMEEWENVLKLMDSENPSDWKLAIIEADSLLDRLVQKMGYPGNNLGERLKAVEPSDFKTLQSAWEAHKIRNAIAHSQGYQLSKREAGRVIAHFEAVFKEFHYI